MTEKEFFKKYITPHLWEGNAWMDGGWGDKNKVLALTEEERSFKVPLYVMPTMDSFEVTHEGGMVQVREVNQRYHVAFPGYNFLKVTALIKKLVRAGELEQKWVFNSFVSSKLPASDQEVFRFVVKVEKGKISYSVLKGEFIPSFVRNTIVAKWA